MEFIRHRLKFSHVVLVLLANFTGAFAWGLFAPLFALVVIDRGGSASQVGLLWGGYTLLTGVLMLVFGRIEDSYHVTKRLLIAGTVLLIVASVVLIFSKDTAGLIISQFLFGVGFGMSMPALKAVYSKLLDHGKEATQWALMDGGNMLVMSAAALVGGYLYQYAQPQALYIVMSVMFAVSTFAYMLVIAAFKKNF